jgi:hypothetical protein
MAFLIDITRIDCSNPLATPIPLDLSMSTNPLWDDTRRVEAWASEVRVNLFRMAALTVFYANHLLTYFFGQDVDGQNDAYHTKATAVVLAWTALIVGLHACLSRRYVPAWLKYAATAWDTVLITALLMIGADPRSMLAMLYFLVIGAAALRLSLPLVYASTLGAMACYAFFLGYVRWTLEIDAAHRLSRAQQIIVLLALGAAGILAGQAVRQARRLVQGGGTVVEEGQP